MAERFTLDAYAPLAYFQGEASVVAIRRLSRKAERGRTELHLDLVNLGEIYYIIYRQRDEDTANQKYAEIRSGPIVLHDVSEPILLTAGRLKAEYAISCADAFAASTAITTDSVW